MRTPVFQEDDDGKTNHLLIFKIIPNNILLLYYEYK